MSAAGEEEHPNQLIRYMGKALGPHVSYCPEQDIHYEGIHPHGMGDWVYWMRHLNEPRKEHLCTLEPAPFLGGLGWKKGGVIDRVMAGRLRGILQVRGGQIIGVIFQNGWIKCSRIDILRAPR